MKELLLNYILRDVFSLTLTVFITVNLLIIIYVYTKNRGMVNMDSVRIFFKKMIKLNRNQQKEFVFTQVLILCMGFVLSALLFALSAIFVEYPSGKYIYQKNQKGLWEGTAKRVLHQPFAFEGFKIDKNIGEEVFVRIDIFEVKFRVVDLKTFLDYMEEKYKWYTNVNQQKIKDVIKGRLHVLQGITPKDLFKDNQKRLEVFREFYSDIGVEITSVNLIL